MIWDWVTGHGSAEWWVTWVTGRKMWPIIIFGRGVDRTRGPINFWVEMLIAPQMFSLKLCTRTSNLTGAYVPNTNNSPYMTPWNFFWKRGVATVTWPPQITTLSHYRLLVAFVFIFFLSYIQNRPYTYWYCSNWPLQVTQQRAWPMPDIVSLALFGGRCNRMRLPLVVEEKT